MSVGAVKSSAPVSPVVTPPAPPKADAAAAVPVDKVSISPAAARLAAGVDRDGDHDGS